LPPAHLRNGSDGRRVDRCRDMGGISEARGRVDGDGERGERDMSGRGYGASSAPMVPGFMKFVQEAEPAGELATDGEASVGGPVGAELAGLAGEVDGEAGRVFDAVAGLVVGGDGEGEGSKEGGGRRGHG